MLLKYLLDKKVKITIDDLSFYDDITYVCDYKKNTKLLEGFKVVDAFHNSKMSKHDIEEYYFDTFSLETTSYTYYVIKRI